ncbi:hypothetical protein L6452_38687 [Arctium lappa]|uniref:Uncharacterized protein n=1 Tax=Arctium lappa TaxID=4217 RepID=A0ACB8XPS5_ARCLA|nr:hypothetical protein L6452_38687 [Arctium lappa]
MYCLKSLGVSGDWALKSRIFGVRGHPGDHDSDCARGHNSLALSPKLRSSRYMLGDYASDCATGIIAWHYSLRVPVGSWELESQNPHLHFPHQVQRLGARVELLDWVFSESLVIFNGFGSSRLEDSSGLQKSSLGKI